MVVTSRNFGILIILTLSFVCFTLVWANINSVPIARTNAPNVGAGFEPNCRDGCHSSNPLNAAGGTLSITAPAQYVPGDTLTMVVNLEKDGQRRWGFEGTALNASRLPAGNFIVTDIVHTSKATGGNGRQYIKHVGAGTYPGTLNQSPGWTFDWAAPVAGTGTVTFYFVGNAANNDNTNIGDFIYSKVITMTEAPVNCCDGSLGNIDCDPAQEVDISDLQILIDHLFISNNALCCEDEGNLDGDAGGSVDISDLQILIDHLFISNAPLPTCQ